MNGFTTVSGPHGEQYIIYIYMYIYIFIHTYIRDEHPSASTSYFEVQIPGIRVLILDNGGAAIARWFGMEKSPKKICMIWGYLHLRKPPYFWAKNKGCDELGGPWGPKVCWRYP
jgi:hypothetical protein